jgi:hypothetical protein
VFPAFADEAALLSWLSEPPPPGLQTLTGPFEFPPAEPHPHGEWPASWIAADPARASWPVQADCPAACTAVPLQPHEEPDWFCVPLCVVVPVFPEVADEAALFVCETFPSLPGLQIRTGALSFAAPICFASESAPEICLVDASCPSAWTPEPACDCVSVWPVVAVFPEVAEEAALFVCETLPPPPALPMLTGSLSFDGPIWTALESARLPWSVWADWPLAWTPLPRQPHCGLWLLPE